MVRDPRAHCSLCQGSGWAEMNWRFAAEQACQRPSSTRGGSFTVQKIASVPCEGDRTGANNARCDCASGVPKLGRIREPQAVAAEPERPQSAHHVTLERIARWSDDLYSAYLSWQTDALPREVGTSTSAI